MLSTVVILIVVVVVVSRKAACKQKRDVIVNDNNNTVVVLQEQKMLEQGVGADYNDAHGINQGEDDDEDLLNFDVGYNPYEAVDRTLHSKNTMTPTPKNFATPATVPRVDAVYAVVDKSKKKSAKKKTEDEPTVINKDDLYAMPMAKEVKMTDKGRGVVVSGSVEEGNTIYDDVVELTYMAKTDSIPR